MKRTLALFCAFAMLLTICGCRETKVETSVLSYYGEDGVSTNVTSNTGDGNLSENASTGNTVTSGSTGSNSTIDNPLNVNLKGATVTIYDVSDNFNPDASKSKADAARADAIKTLQKKLNCKLEVKKVEINKLQSLAVTSASAGKAASHIMVVDIFQLGAFIATNLTADLGKISSMDLSKDYMNAAGLLDASRFGNGRYAVSANYFNYGS